MLKDPPILTIRREFRRPPRELIAKLAGAQTGHIVDALQGRGALDHHVKPVDPGRVSFVGAALTCECGANDNLAIMAALVVAQPGDVIIAACDGFAATAGVGDNLAMMAKNKGVAAVVTDGVVVIPQAQLESVVAALSEIRRMEEETQQKIRAGMTHLDSVAELLKSDQ